MSISQAYRAIIKHVPIEFRVMRNRRRPDVRRERQRVQAAWGKPSPEPRRGTSKDQVWAVSMVHNERDVIAHVVGHLLNQGIDGLIIADNNSTDGTSEILQTLVHKAPLYIVDDLVPEFYQATKMTILSDMARKAGAEWIVPFDADELWFAEGTSLADSLRRSPACMVEANMHNFFPSLETSTTEPDPFSRMRCMDTVPTGWNKVAFRAHRFAEVAAGNHSVKRRGGTAQGLHIAHYPWRNFDQLRAKARHGAEATESAVQAPGINHHWRAMASLTDTELASVWADMAAGKSVEPIAWFTSGESKEVDITSWDSWLL